MAHDARPRRDSGLRELRWSYAAALCDDTGATLDDLREAVTTLEDGERACAARARGRAPERSGDGGRIAKRASRAPRRRAAALPSLRVSTRTSRV